MNMPGDDATPDDIPYLIPDPLKEGARKFVKPPARRHEMPAPLILDVLSGDLTGAGQTLLDWLRDFPERYGQFATYQRLLRALVVQAVRRATHADASVSENRPHFRYRNLCAHDWEFFCERVRELFAFDLVSQEDSLRFVIDVLAPGKLGGEADGSAGGEG